MRRPGCAVLISNAAALARKSGADVSVAGEESVGTEAAQKEEASVDKDGYG